MQKMKAISVMLLMMAILVVAACSKDSNNAGNKETTQPTEGVKNTETATASPAPTEEPMDLKGYTMKLLVWGGPPDGSTEIGEAQLAREKELEKKYNVNIEWVAVPWGESVPKITAAGLAGEPVADIALLHNYWAFPSLADNGYLMPIEDLFDLNDPNWPENVKEFGTFNGKAYGFLSSISNAYGLYYNRSLLKREGLPDPHDLVKEDKWNWDSFLDIMKRTTKDTDSDGITDQWGITSHTGMLAKPLIYSNDGSVVDTVDGKQMFTMGEPNAIEALRYLYDLYHTHKVAAPNKHGNYTDYEDSQTIFNSGKAAFVPGAEWEGGGRLETMEDEFGFVMFPKGPKATEYTNTQDGFAMWYVLSNSKYPKEVARIWYEMQLWDRLVQRDREWIESNMSTPEDVDMVFNMAQYTKPIYYGEIGSGDNKVSVKEAEAIREIGSMGVAPESAVEKIKKPVQELLDTVINNKE